MSTSVSPRDARIKRALNHGGTGVISNDFDVHGVFLPMVWRKYNPIELLISLQSYLASRPVTSSSTSHQVLTNNISCFPLHEVPDEFLLMCGYWNISKGRGSRYWNPEYIHGHNEENCYTSREARTKIAHDVASYGFLRRDTLYPMFGMTPDEYKTYFEYDERYLFDALKREGRITSARTFATLREWEYSTSEISLAFGVPQRTILDYIKKYSQRQHRELPGDELKLLRDTDE